jgi:hypothetical protein
MLGPLILARETLYSLYYAHTYMVVLRNVPDIPAGPCGFSSLPQS